KTRAQYLRSLHDLGAEVYRRGRRVPDVTKDGFTRLALDGIGEIYALARDPQHRAQLTRTEEGKTFNVYTSIHRSPEDIANRVRVARLLCQRTGVCTASRCCGWDAINALWHTTHEVDARSGTRYHRRLRRYVEMLRRRDLTVAGALTDPKGNRALKPRHQPDPDAYLRVVDRDKKGIVVRGAKTMIGGAVGSHEILVQPGTGFSEDERDHAVAFAVPMNADGVTQVVDRQMGDERKLEEGFDKGNVRFGSSESLVAFDDVFVPWERVFLCGEHEYAADAVTKFVLLHRTVLGGCLAGMGDVLTGAAALLAEYHGVSRPLQDRLAEMTFLSESLYAQALGAAYQGFSTPSGAWFPDPLLANVTKASVTRLPYEIQRLAEDIGGGMISCMPSEADLRSPRVGPLVEKYYRTGVPAEKRLRAARLVESMVFGPGKLSTLCLHGGGSPAAAMMGIRQLADLERKKDLARRLAGIEG
ncbi:MAG TPA: 4-hydroxyphenylacetate 3-hydroxylase N-terminal domain-containing protein, partial [Thermoplasmata archaeon]|nr:4-hydroxyphenylacetate 3-hydroxylase N-terminal domain-containing protein [Thermoplasmata archaeon]